MDYSTTFAFTNPGSDYPVKMADVLARLTIDTNKVDVLQIFVKSDASTPAFTKTGAGTVSVKAGTAATVGDSLLSFAAATAIAMPALSAGTDYAIYVCTDGTARADTNFSAPTGYTTANSRQIGGFHYAPGGNATGVAGGDAVPAINASSIWDLKFRPARSDPRGMALAPGGLCWGMIYLLNQNHIVNGPSAYNVTIADGASPPKIPLAFGGDGTAAYGSMTWWEANEVLASYQMRSPSCQEFAALAYGTTENATAVAGTDPVSTILRSESTSACGIMLSTGNLFTWGRDLGGPYNTTAGWVSDTGGRGQSFNQPYAVLLGGYFNTAASGSRSSNWGDSLSTSAYSIGARGVCDHLQLN